MADIKLLFGYDTERPHGKLARTKNGRQFRQKQLLFVQKLLGLLDELIVPRTLFVLGDYLDRCLDDFSIGELRTIYNPVNPLNDLQQHSYSHKPIRPFRGIEGVVLNGSIMTSAEFAKDLGKANRAISSILGATSSGLRTPYGYDRDLSDMPELLGRFSELGLNFVSSNLRGGIKPLYAELSLERQPHTYAKVGFPGIVEIPSCGWQDAIYTKEKAILFLHRMPDKPNKILQNFERLFDEAFRLTKHKRPIYICLCLHPWAVMEYDPELEIHCRIIEMVRFLKIEIIPYRQVADEVLRYC